MKYSTLAMIMGIGVFGCASTDKAVSVTDAGAQNQGGAGGTGGAKDCDESVCEGKTYMGQTLATCCFSKRGCGVILDGTCVAPITIAERGREGGSASPFGTGETVVLDPTCPDSAFMGAALTLKGCCDKTGVCGASTEGIGANLGVAIPAMCITPKEAERFGQRPEGGAERSCSYPADAGSPADASTRD